MALGASRARVVFATFRRPLFQVALGIIVGTVIIFTGAMLFRNTEFPGSENDLTLQGMAMIIWRWDGHAGRLHAGLRGPDTPRAPH